MKPIFIAEIKTKSPFGFVAKEPFHKLLDLALEYGDWISVHTNPLWGGSFEQIEFIRRLTDKPILAKGIHSLDSDIQRAIDYGADRVLVVDRLPSYGWLKKCLIELNYEKAQTLLDLLGDSDNKNLYHFVSNCRDLKTGEVKWDEDLGKYLTHKNCQWLCQASGIREPYQVNPKVKAFIVGEHLSEFCEKVKIYGR